ncbi:MAG: SGNH/GDSL hydrolase family protein, partial [Nitrospinae bacterium]|nr:SGNH/GDSL hydrolase family protein [Nitrospinota bacterium]
MKRQIGVLISVGIFFIYGLGFLSGYIVWVSPFGKQVDALYSKNYLGQVISGKSKKKKSLAYLDPQKAYVEMDNYVWGVPHIMTPFVNYGSRPGKYRAATINSMQFRSSRELITPKPKNSFRIFLTGGSTAFGSGSPSNEQTIGGYLESNLNNKNPNSDIEFEVFTMAVPAWTTTHERIIIENRLSEMDPDLIISFSGLNDVHWGFLGANIQWFSANNVFINITNIALGFFGKDPMPDVMDKVLERIDCDQVSYRLKKNIEIIHYTVSKKNINYIFTLQPNISVTGKKLHPMEKSHDEKNIMKGVKPYFRNCYNKIDENLRNMKASNFQYVNLTKIFNSNPEDEVIFLDCCHFGDRGNKIIAANIYNS